MLYSSQNLVAYFYSGSSGADVIAVPMPGVSGSSQNASAPGAVFQQQTLRTSHSSYAVAVEKIEATMTELTHMFQHLASVVAEQGDVLDR